MEDSFRSPDGRFAPGNPGGPGRPRRTVEADYLRTMSDEVSLDDWRAIVRRAKSGAMRGEPKAREWLSEHLLKRSSTLEEQERQQAPPSDTSTDDS